MMKQRLLIALLVVCVLAVLSVYTLPAFLSSVLVSKIQQATGKTVTLASVQFSPLPLAINLHQLTLQERNAQPFVSIENSYVTLSIWQSLQQHTLVVDQLILTKPVVHIVQHQDGHFNYDDLFNSAPDDTQNTPVFPFTINKLSLLNGTLKWDAAAIKETIENIGLTASNISTTTDSKSQLQLQLKLASGGDLNWQAEVSLSPLRSTGHIELKQLKLPSSLGIDLTGQGGLSSDYQLHYAKQRFDFTAEHAKLELHDFKYSDNNQLVIKSPEFKHESDIVLSYVNNVLSLTAKHSKIKLSGFAMSGNSPEINIAEFNHATDFKINYQQQAWHGTFTNSTLEARGLQLNFPHTTLKIPSLTLNSAIDSQFANSKLHLSSTQGQLQGSNVQLLGNHQDKPMLEMPTLNAQGVDFNLTDRVVSIASLTGNGTKARTWLNSAGQFHYPVLFPVDTNNNNANTATANDNADWRVKVKQFALTQAEIAFVDHQQNPPVSVNFAPVNFKVSDYNNQTGTKLPFELTTGVNKTGNIQLIGNSIFAPFSMQLMLNAQALELAPFQAYFEKIARLNIVKGQFTTKGELSINTNDNKPLALKFTGDASIAQLVTRDQIQHQDFITWKNLTLKSLAVDLAKNDYSAAALTLEKPYTRLTVNKNKTINFSDIFINKTPAKTGKEKTAKTSDTALPFTFKLANLKVVDGSSDFTDNSLILPFEAQIDHLSGGASDISSDKKSSIKLSLKGSAYDLSPVDIDGEVSPYLGNYDLNVNFVEMPMPLISPYMVQFAGYKVEKGKMTLKLKYKVFGDQLNASNNIMIDQFELGEKVENPNAVSLPLELGIALLKDSDGKIKIDIPITGSMNSPEFDMGAVISDALVNALGKVISSPFTALAELIGEDAEEVSTVRFNAGKAELDNKQQQELAAIANLLKQNSSLVLDIKGKAFQQQDWPAIREAALYDELKELRAQEINQYQDNNVILPQYIQLSDSEYRRLLAELFIAKFPKLAKKSLLGTPVLIDSKAGDFYEVAKQHLSVDITPDPSRLRELAIQRARAIASYLVQLGVTSDQIFILDPAVESKKDTSVHDKNYPVSKSSLKTSKSTNVFNESTAFCSLS